MTLDDFNNVLTLMSAIILADKHVFETEITAFIQCASQIDFNQAFTDTSKLTITPDLAISPPPPSENDCSVNALASPPQLSKWFEENESRIRRSLATPYYKDWFYNLLDQLSGLPNKEKIISVMRDISKADGKVHISERTLITLAERHWGLR